MAVMQWLSIYSLYPHTACAQHLKKLRYNSHNIQIWRSDLGLFCSFSCLCVSRGASWGRHRHSCGGWPGSGLPAYAAFLCLLFLLRLNLKCTISISELLFGLLHYDSSYLTGQGLNMHIIPTSKYINSNYTFRDSGITG